MDEPTSPAPRIEPDDGTKLVQQAMPLLLPPPGRMRDLKRAHRLLSQAIDLGHVGAMRLRASLLATGTGSAVDPQGALALIRRCASLGNERSGVELTMVARMVGHKVGPPEQLSTYPRVELVRNFLTQPECAYLMVLADPRFEPSMILDRATGERRPDPVRTSDGMSFGPIHEDIVINAINHRVAMATGTRYDHGEPLHMLRYRGGQEYRPHGDALPGSGNLRNWTAIMYLNDDYSGGETEFPDLGLRIRGRTGDLLLFCNVDLSGKAEPLSKHAGRPVTRGTKYIATRWVHAKRYHPWA